MLRDCIKLAITAQAAIFLTHRWITVSADLLVDRMRDMIACRSRMYYVSIVQRRDELCMCVRRHSHGIQSERRARTTSQRYNFPRPALFIPRREPARYVVHC
ncbi:hypothetical protein BC835DRAFT_331278 [Cytidiella melzeri]|nr:hypothetical protein BC835DRAFT_331278 [Cytidiella melzeri]